MIEINSIAEKLIGFQVIDCDIINSNHFAFTLREDYSQWPSWDGGDAPGESELIKRILELDLTKPEGEKWTSFDIKHFPDIDISATLPFSKSYLAMRLNGESFEIQHGNLSKKYDELPDRRHHENGIRRGVFTKVKAYKNVLLGVTARRQLLTFNGSEWKHVGQEINEIEGQYAYGGFTDFDLFSLEDIYAGGGKGDLWHYNGNVWQQIDFPSNKFIRTICCGGDGYVYITVGSATIYKGRDNEWELIHDEKISLYFKDAVWYEDKMWCTNDYGIWVLDNDTFERQEESLPTDVLVSAGYLAQRDGVLLVGGYAGAAFKKDGGWVTAINQMKVNEYMKK